MPWWGASCLVCTLCAVCLHTSQASSLDAHWRTLPDGQGLQVTPSACSVQQRQQALTLHTPQSGPSEVVGCSDTSLAAVDAAKKWQHGGSSCSSGAYRAKAAGSRAAIVSCV